MNIKNLIKIKLLEINNFTKKCQFGRNIFEKTNKKFKKLMLKWFIFLKISQYIQSMNIIVWNKA